MAGGSLNVNDQIIWSTTDTMLDNSSDLTTRSMNDAILEHESFLNDPSVLQGVRYFGGIVIILIMAVGISGNLLTIVALTRCRKVHNASTTLIISLSIADLIFCVFNLPFFVSESYHGAWVHGSTLCKIFGVMAYGNVGVSLLTITAITINRCIMIAHNHLYTRVYRRHWVALMITFCWIFSYGMQIPTALGVWGSFSQRNEMENCKIVDESGESSKRSLFLMAMVVPGLMLIGCYSRIFFVVYKSEQKLRKHAENLENLENNNQECREAKMKRKEWRVAKMILVIILVFFLGFLPVTVLTIIDDDERYPALHIIVALPVFLASAVNPIIYAIMNKQYRQAFLDIYYMIICRSTAWF